MKTRIVALMALVVVLALPLTLYAQDTDPVSVVQALHDALNEGDVDAALSLLADDAVVSIVPPPEGTAGVHTGKEEIRGWYERLVGANGVATVGDCQVDGETVTCINTYTDDGLQAIGVDFLEGEWVGIVRDGTIQSYTFTLTPESLAKFPPPPEAVPVTGGPAPSSYGSTLLMVLGGLAILGGLGLLRRSAHQRG